MAFLLCYFIVLLQYKDTAEESARHSVLPSLVYKLSGLSLHSFNFLIVDEHILVLNSLIINEVDHPLISLLGIQISTFVTCLLSTIPRVNRFCLFFLVYLGVVLYSKYVLKIFFLNRFHFYVLLSLFFVRNHDLPFVIYLLVFCGLVEEIIAYFEVI